MKKIYLASSWRNKHQETLVKQLIDSGFDVYDFKHPNGGNGFQWSRIDTGWQNWSMEEYRQKLKDDYAQFGLNRDFDAMKEADICILLLPCGRSANLEAGWMKGAGKQVYAYIPNGEKIEAELMYGILDGIALSLQELLRMLEVNCHVKVKNIKRLSYKDTSGVCGDCTTWYDVGINDGATLKDLVGILVDDTHDSWKEIEVVRQFESRFEDPICYCEIRDSKIIGEIPEVYLNRMIKSIKANGGYGQMSYYVILKDDKGGEE